MFRKLSLLFVAVSLTLVISPIKAENTVTITSITPNTANNWGTIEITDLAGTGFVDGAMVTLTRAGQNDIRVIPTVESSIKIFGGFHVIGAEVGAWDIVVTNPDGQVATMVGGFNLTLPPAPTIISNTPDISENMGYSTVDLTGTNFLHGAHVKLTRAGYEDVDAVSVRLESYTAIVCEFNLTGVAAGHWDVVVINPDGQSGISNSIDIIEFEGTSDFLTVAANYYVDVVNGSNSNNGRSWGAAWKTIRHALSRVGAYGSVIAVAPGTYNRASGEYFPLQMREGVSLIGVAGPQETIIDASGGTIYVISYYGDTRIRALNL